jgi:membrane peptidoglycan carboxypeptidase
MNSSLKTLKITFVALAFVTVALVIADALALLYLYSFDRDPKNWTNLNVFFSRPKQGLVGQGIARESLPMGSLIVRGNDGQASYAIQYKLTLGDIRPSLLHDCLLAVEDRRFYRHTGMDYMSIFKAIYDRLIYGVRLRGASTISNQLMRTVILADQSRLGLQGIGRKIAETILTSAAERHFSKDDLLVSYVNNVPIGHLNQTALIGFSVAGEALFGKRDPKSLSLSEACTLAGMLNRPNHYLQDASKGDYRSIKARRDKVLENLGRAYPDRYPEAVINRAKKETVRVFRNKQMPATEPRQLISYAYQQLPSRKPGLRVYLTADYDLQRAAENSVNEKLYRFDRGPYGFYNHLSYRHALKEGRKITEEESKLQAAFVAVDAKTGEILAIVGGRKKSEFNRTTQAKRAPGSVIKPFVYLYGIQSGSYGGQRFRADTIIDPSRNLIAQRYTTGGVARATVQLARSDNGAAVAIADQFGIARVRNFIAKVTGVNPVESELIAIGAGKGMELSPLEVATAYTVFPNDGLKVTPKPIWSVYDGDKKMETAERKNVRVVDSAAASTLTKMLQAVIGDVPDGQYGTARMARQLSGLDSSVALAGKTGTGDNDLWFVGFTARLVVVVWVGFDNNFPPFEASKGFTGSGLPLQMWARFMRDVKKYRPDLLQGTFEVASGVMELTIDPERGCLSQNEIKEYFLVNRVPADC